MKTVKIKLKDLNQNPDNCRKHTQKQIDEFVKSIELSGVLRPIVCDEDNVILCGHGLYLALMQTGAETADCIVLKDLTEAQKKKSASLG